MDNVTHSLAGLVLAEAALRLRARRTGKEPSPGFRTIATLTSLGAANLPDTDLLYTGIGGDPLAYMLHHRGHTHTVLIAVLGAVLLWVAVMLIWRRFGRSAPSSGDARWLFGLLLISTLSHLFLDWTNSYGVHPFWPVDNRWKYGDAVFIVEPWFWVISVPALVASSTSRVARGLLSALLLIGLILAWVTPIVSFGAALALMAGTAISITLARTLRPEPRIASTIAIWLAVTLVMAAGSAVARQTVAQAVRESDPDAELLDVVVTPLPANPVCLTIVTAERAGDAYRVATARVSSVPSLIPASRCGSRFSEPPVSPPLRPSDRRVQWDTDWEAPQAEIAALAQESCPALAALQFMRVPVWRFHDDSTATIGDARFGGIVADGAFSLRVPRRSSTCPLPTAPWTPPRHDLLRLGH